MRGSGLASYGLALLIFERTMNFITLQETVGATEQQLPANPVVNSITLKASSTNTGTVYIGNSSGVSSSNGYALEKGDLVTLKLADTSQVFYVGTASDVLSVIGS